MSMSIDLNQSASREENCGLTFEEEINDPSSEGSSHRSFTTIFGNDLEKRIEVGSKLDSLDEIYILYCEYARSIGFNVKKGTQSYFIGCSSPRQTADQSSDLRMKVYYCSCKGFPDNKRARHGIPCYKKQVTRCDCKAQLRVVHDAVGGPWMVIIFEKEHNHELLSPEQSYLLRSVRNMSYAKKSVVEALKSAGIGVSRACKFMESEAGGRKNVGFIHKDAYDHINHFRRVSYVDCGDAYDLLEFLNKKDNEEPLLW